jgi:hypothetical protein
MTSIHRYKLIFYIILGCLISCVAKTHHKKDLIDFRTNKISANQLKLDGYYFMTYEKELTNLNSYERSVRQAGIKTAKSIDVYFINDDGFTHYMRSINGLTNYYCMQSDFKPENSYEKLHQIIEMFIANSKSEDKKVRKSCNFKPNDISGKGLTKIEDGKIKIQYFVVQSQNPNSPGFNSYYLVEMNGTVKNDTTFVMEELKKYRTNETQKINFTYRLKKTKAKPEVPNYFKNGFR